MITSIAQVGDADCEGGCFEESQAYFGAMDEIRLWRSERSAEEIVALMYASGDAVLKSSEATRDLAGYWPLDDKGGNVARDRSPGGTLLSSHDILSMVNY